MIRTSIDITISDQIGSTGSANSQKIALMPARQMPMPALDALRVNSSHAPISAIAAQAKDSQPRTLRLLASSQFSGRYSLLSRAPMPHSRFETPVRPNITPAKVNQPVPAGRWDRAVAMAPSDHPAPRL